MNYLLSTLLIYAILILFIASFSALFFAFRVTGAKLIFEKKNKYHHIMVYEEGSIRTLYLGDGPDDGKHTRIDLNDPDYLILEYTRLIFAGLLINDKPFRILIVGLGGGAVPRAIERYIPFAEIDVVDIDPDVVEVSKKYFLFDPGEKVRLHVCDGRAFILKAAKENPDRKYDMIIMDAFNSSSIPTHLTTKEFLKEIMLILQPNGVIATNVLIDNKLFHSILKTYRKVFNRTYVFIGGRTQNAVFISPGTDASDLDNKLAAVRAEGLQKFYRFSFSMTSVARQFRSRYSPKISARVLTDSQYS